MTSLLHDALRTILFAGTDTTSNILVRTLEKLAMFPGWQDKLRQELAGASNYPSEDSEIPYDQLMALPLLDAICRETLRWCVPLLLPPFMLYLRRTKRMY